MGRYELDTMPETGPAEFGGRMRGAKYNTWRLKRNKRLKAANGGTLPKKYRRV